MVAAVALTGGAVADTGYSGLFTLDLRVAPPSVSSFTASPSTIAEGQPSTLSWATTGGTSAWIDPSVGDVGPSGSATVTPTQTTTYTLTVQGPAGVSQAQATVSVTQQGFLLTPASLVVPLGGTGTLTPTLSPVRASETVIGLATSNAAIATVPSSVTVAANAASATLSVSGLAIGTAQVTATLPAELGGGTAVSAVSVVCPTPRTPQATGPSGPLPSGSAFNLAWSDVFAGTDPDGAYEAQLALDSAFGQLATTLRTQARSATLTVPAHATDAVYARVRAIAGCAAAGGFSPALPIAVTSPPATVILTQGQTPSWAVTAGAQLPRATLRLRNVGGAPASVSFVATGGFFTVSPASAPLAADQEIAVTLTGTEGATSATGLKQGSVAAAWSGGVVAASVSLSVAASVANVVPLVDNAFVFNLAPPGGVSTQVLEVTNPAEVPITLAPSIGPGGAWLSVEPLDVAQPIPAGQTQVVRLRIDRSRRTAADGEPPVFTLLDVRAVGADTGRLVRVFDADLPEVTSTDTRAPSVPATPTFIMPAVVHAPGQSGALFTSDGWIRNLSARAIPVQLIATPRAGGPALVAEKTLPGLALVRLYDLVQGVFGSTNLAANVEVRPRSLADAGQLTVRITTDGQPSGGKARQRYSVEIPVYASGVGTGMGQPALFMPGVDVTSSIRTNIILSETSGSAASVTMKLYGADGALVARTASPLSVGAYGVTQDSLQSYLGLPAGLSIRSATLRIEGAAGTGRVVAIGTAIDNVSQSFRALTADAERTTEAATGLTTSRASLAAVGVKPVVIPSIVHARGINAFFTTLLAISNGTASNAPLRFVYTYGGTDDEGQAVSGTKTVDLTLKPRESLAAGLGNDIVTSLLGMPPGWSTSGPLRIEGTGVGQVVIKSWVQTPSDPNEPAQNLKYAEFHAFHATSPEAIGRGGQTVVLSSGVSKMSGQRTNVILAEVAGDTAQVTVTLVDGATGLRIGQSEPVVLKPYEKIQVNDAELWALLGLSTGERDRMQMVLEAVGTGDGRVVGVVTQIDNATNATLVTPFAPAGPQSPGIGVGR